MIMDSNLLHTYLNGGYRVNVYSDGTKVRIGSGDPSFPESIDVKITNYCDLGCKYCHESSTKKGKHGDLVHLTSILSVLPQGVELALGGGNPLDHPSLEDLLKFTHSRGLINNLTINQGHLVAFHDKIVTILKSGTIKAIGLSITSSNFRIINRFKELCDKYNVQVVAHVIAGVNDVGVLNTLQNQGISKVLVLGYKEYGFGKKFLSKKVRDNKLDWFNNFYRLSYGLDVISFDNLALSQLNVSRYFTSKQWENRYMGDDFTFSMYIDAVTKTYAPTSRSSERYNWTDIGLVDYFITHRIKKQ